jgi:mono/diheme cytochrome c family protein
MQQERQRISIGPWLFGIIAGLIIIALLIAAYSTGYDQGKKDATAHPATPPSATQQATPAATGPGRALFAGTCGKCHTLNSAGTHGTVGPNLDQLKPDQARVLAAIENGGTGSGIMPKGLFSGTQAKQIAQFVSQTAGH